MEGNGNRRFWGEIQHQALLCEKPVDEEEEQREEEEEDGNGRDESAHSHSAARNPSTKERTDGDEHERTEERSIHKHVIGDSNRRPNHPSVAKTRLNMGMAHRGDRGKSGKTISSVKCKVHSVNSGETFLSEVLAKEVIPPPPLYPAASAESCNGQLGDSRRRRF